MKTESPSLLTRSKTIIGKLTLAASIVTATGCAGLQDIGLSQVEIPSVENQLNRVMVGTTIVRINDQLSKMEISSDAKWPSQLDQDLTTEARTSIEQKLEQTDPYVSTHHLTDKAQEETLGGFAFATPKVNPVVLSAVNRVQVVYGEDMANWPTIFDLTGDFSTYEQFTDGKPKMVESLSGNVYENFETAAIALLPVNYQKDLEESRKEMMDAFAEVALAEAEIGALESSIESGLDSEGTELSQMAILELEEKVQVIEQTLESKTLVADEKEEIYLTQLDQAVEALIGDIDLSEENIKLAKNIQMVADNIQSGAVEASTVFTLALANLTAKGLLNNFDVEVGTLAASFAFIPRDLHDIMKARIERLKDNFIYAIPATGIGYYYAIKQALLAGKYSDITEIILEADEARKEMLAEQEAEVAALQ